MTENIDDTIRELAVSTLMAVCRDFEAPAAARAQASRTLLETIGVLGKSATGLPDDARDLSTMSAAELDEEIRRLSRNGPVKS